jgi:fatty-acyl-CoA synthase
MQSKLNRAMPSLVAGDDSMKASQDSSAMIAPRDNLSYVRGSTDILLSEVTIGQFLRDTARRFPDRPAVVFCEQRIRWTWRAFDDQVDRLACGLTSIGISRGDRVGIWSPNRAEWLLTQFATARIGAVLVNINPAYRVAEVEFALTKVGCKALITAERFKSSDYLAMLLEIAPELAVQDAGQLEIARLPELRIILSMGTADLQGVLGFNDVMETGLVALEEGAGRALDAIGAELSAYDPINVQFTSGTTGSPKGATLTHRNIVNNSRFVAMAMNLSDADALCIPVPLYHCFGMVLAVLACVSVGANRVPTMFIAELEHPQFASFDLSRLRTGIMAGSPCPIETMKQVVAKMHLQEITIAYGMTETSPISFQSSTTDPLDKRTTTVGRVQPHLEVKLVDGSGNIVPIGMTGELCTKGYSVMQGYWQDEGRTRESIVDGWMHTGDLATLDADGYCNIVGRLKDMLIRGGENIYPREVEEFLFRHPKIQNVQVFGVPDERSGEEVCAWIVLRQGEGATEDEIRDFCRGQIAHYKVPKYIQFVSELPMTVTGKVQKFVMREQMIQLLKLTGQKTV